MKKSATAQTLLRQRPRALVKAPVWVRGQTQSELFPALIMDISESGARLNTLPRDCPQNLVLEWVPVPGLKALTLSARRMWSEKDCWGIRFVHLTEKERKILRAIIRFQRAFLDE